MKRVFIALLAAGLCFSPNRAAAATEFPEYLKADETRLLKSGEATFRFLKLFKAFDAALYLQEGYSADQFPGDFRFSLNLRYHRPFTRDQLINSADEILNDLYPDEVLLDLDEKIEAINQVYQDVSKGDQYTLFYDPDLGTQLLLNDEPQTTIEGFDFAQAYFAIWLGNHPATKRLSKALLDQS